MNNPAMVIPMDCIRNEKTLASCGSISNSLVKTGNATAPPPSEVAPAIKYPNTIVSEIGQVSANMGHHSRIIIAMIQADTITPAVTQYNRSDDLSVTALPDSVISSDSLIRIEISVCCRHIRQNREDHYVCHHQ